MIAVNDSSELDELERVHQEMLESSSNWTKTWQAFYENPWFSRRLDSSARRLVRKFNLPFQWQDDVKQEALLVFARSIQRDQSLGFDSSRGSYGAFLSTIIHRCCQKGLRQFSRSSNQSIDNESQHPLFEMTESLDEHLDLKECLRELPEPYKLTIRLICYGKSIPEIAEQTGRSTRTVYRWMEKGVELLRKSWELSDLPSRDDR